MGLNKKYRIWFLLVIEMTLLIGGAMVHAQEGYNEYLNKARTYFRSGDYERAASTLEVYRLLTGKTDQDLAQKISSCGEYQQKAVLAETENRYEDALGWYLLLRVLNPEDPNVGKRIEVIRERIPQGNSTSSRPISSSPQSYYIENKFGINMKMVWVEGGSFIMGCTGEQGSDCASDEKNTHSVNLTGYYIGMTEVTQGQWQKVMGTSIEQQRNKANPGWSFYGTGSDYPMYYVSWEEAMAFCEELSRQTGKKYTLPTEAQWEYAARGGNKNDGTKYSGSYSIDAVAWYKGNSGASTHIVGLKRPNGLGIYDMSGNVWEWCKDWYADSYIEYQTDNPIGPSSGAYRVFRGGGWDFNATYCRVADRSYGTPGYLGFYVGFRVVCLP